MDIDKARRFTEALETLCKAHGVMLWPSYETMPIMASDVHENDQFQYVVLPAEITTSTAKVRRVLR